MPAFDSDRSVIRAEQINPAFQELRLPHPQPSIEQRTALPEEEAAPHEIRELLQARRHRYTNAYKEFEASDRSSERRERRIHLREGERLYDQADLSFLKAVLDQNLVVRSEAYFAKLAQKAAGAEGNGGPGVLAWIEEEMKFCQVRACEQARWAMRSAGDWEAVRRHLDLSVAWNKTRNRLEQLREDVELRLKPPVRPWEPPTVRVLFEASEEDFLPPKAGVWTRIGAAAKSFKKWLRL